MIILLLIIIINSYDSNLNILILFYLIYNINIKLIKMIKSNIILYLYINKLEMIIIKY